MNQKKKTGLLVVLGLMTILGSMFQKDRMLTVWAAPADTFSIEAELLPSDRETYDIRLTIENQGEDWEGTVRLTVAEDYRKPTAYDTVLALPQGSKKQFLVKIPVDSVINTSGTVIVTLLNRENKEIAKKEFKRLLVDQMEALSMGILSDAYSELTYLDMGGKEIYFYDNLYPVKLVELQQDTLEETLDALTYLVIDQYDTGILTQEEMEAIELWNTGGGVLIIGTGAYAEDTLKGFDSGYLNVSYTEIVAAEETSESDTSNDHRNEYIDWSRLTMAQLQGTDGMYPDYYLRSYAMSIGSGSLCVVPYSFTELGSKNDIYRTYEQEDFVMQLMENVCNYAGSRFSSSSSYYSNYNSYIGSMLGALGNSNSILNFSVLKGIVIAYVIFVGPLLYLILRSMKRRELYWIAVPTTAILGIGLVFLAGRGFEVLSTRVYSVTVEDLAENGKSMTYLYCYDANRREWDLRLDEGAEYAAPLINTSYYSGLNNPYYYHIKREGDRFLVGINPGSNFEDSYFLVKNSENKNAVTGNLVAEDIMADWSGISGTVINNTNQDMTYFAVIWNDSWYVYKDLPSGASFRLENAYPVFDSSGSYYSSYIYPYLWDIYEEKEHRNASALSALGVGICDVCPESDQSTFVIIGVVENWDKTIDDNCSELSYGCLYSVQ